MLANRNEALVTPRSRHTSAWTRFPVASTASPDVQVRNVLTGLARMKEKQEDSASLSTMGNGGLLKRTSPVGDRAQDQETKEQERCGARFGSGHDFADRTQSVPAKPNLVFLAAWVPVSTATVLLLSEIQAREEV